MNINTMRQPSSQLVLYTYQLRDYEWIELIIESRLK